MVRRIGKTVVLCLFICLLAACQSQEVEQIGETNGNEETVQYLLPQNMSVTEFNITSHEEELKVTSVDQQWSINGSEPADETAVNYFMEDLRKLTGKRVQHEPDREEDLTIELADRSEELTLTIWNDTDEILVKVSDTLYSVESLPMSLAPFSSDYLKKAIELDLSGLKEIRLIGDETITLNQTSELMEVERIPFISGWYLHGLYDTNFSIKYSWMDQLQENLTRIHGEETDLPLEEVVKTIEIISSADKQTIDIGNSVNDTQTLIRVNSLNQNYLIPTQQIDFYQFEPLNSVDNFIALIPLDAVERVDIERGTEQYTLLVERDFSIGEDDEVVIDSTFFLNDQEIEEDTMRRAYQYLARLSYDKELDEERDKQNSDEEPVKLTYVYVNDGESIEKVIQLLPVLNTDNYIVENESIKEFTATDDKLNDLFEAFKELNN